MYPPLKKTNNPLPCLHEWEWVEESEPDYLWQGFVCEKCGQRNEYRPDALDYMDDGDWAYDNWKDKQLDERDE